MKNEKLQPERKPERRELDFGIVGNPLGPSPLVAERLARYAEHPSDQERLLKELTLRLSEWLGVPSEIIVVSAGSDCLIDAIAKLIAPLWPKVAIPVPTYFHIAEAVETNQVPVTPLPGIKQISLPRDDRTSGSLVWVCNPNNPTGTMVDPKVLRSFVEWNRSGMTVVDEAYWEIVDPDNLASQVRLVPSHPNLIVTKTFSKAFGLPEARVGMLFARPEIAALIRAEIQPPTAKGLVAALAGLDDLDHLRRSADWQERELTWLKNEIRRIPGIEIGGEPQVGILMVRHRELSLANLLPTRGIKVVDLDRTDGIRNEHYVRVGLKTRADNQALVDALWQIAQAGRR